MRKVKEFLKKHSSIVVLLVAVLIALSNYLIYPTYIEKELSLDEVWILNQDVKANTKISEDMLTTIKLPSVYLPKSIYIDKKDIVNKYTKRDLCKDSFIYQDNVVDEKMAMGSLFAGLEENNAAFIVEIDNLYNAFNEIKEGQRLDLFYLSEYYDGNISKDICGKLASNVLVLKVVQESNSTKIAFSVLEEDVSYFMLAQQNGKLIPVISTSSNQFIQNKQTIYDINLVKQILQESNMILFNNNETR